jgi:hypothetical protein
VTHELSRTVYPYDPALDMAVRHPGWRTRLSWSDDFVQAYPRARRVDVNAVAYSRDPMLTLSRVVALLDAGLGQAGNDGRLPDDVVQGAMWVAQMRLDRPQDRATDGQLDSGLEPGLGA